MSGLPGLSHLVSRGLLGVVETIVRLLIEIEQFDSDHFGAGVSPSSSRCNCLAVVSLLHEKVVNDKKMHPLCSLCPAL